MLEILMANSRNPNSAGLPAIALSICANLVNQVEALLSVSILLFSKSKDSMPWSTVVLFGIPSTSLQSV